MTGHHWRQCFKRHQWETNAPSSYCPKCLAAGQRSKGVWTDPPPSGETAPTETPFPDIPRWNEARSPGYIVGLDAGSRSSSNDAFPEAAMEALACELNDETNSNMLRQAIASHSALVDLCVSLRTKLRSAGIDP